MKSIEDCSQQSTKTRDIHAGLAGVVSCAAVLGVVPEGSIPTLGGGGFGVAVGAFSDEPENGCAADYG